MIKIKDIRRGFAFFFEFNEAIIIQLLCLVGIVVMQIGHGHF